MSSEFNANDGIKELVSDIISKNNWQPVTEVKYYVNTGTTDGYSSKNVNVDVTSKGETFQLFVKYALEIPNIDMSIEQFYINEANFYDVIYPAYKKFLEKKYIKDWFLNIPKCFGTSSKYVIALENLKGKGYALFDRKKSMDYRHISLALRTIAKFHASSFAFKDQQRDRYDELCATLNQNPMLAQLKEKDSLVMRMMLGGISDALSKLDPDTDKQILEKCDVNALLNSMTDVTFSSEHSIITHGDCWCNNMMFLYAKEEMDNPIDIALIDWQLVRSASPVLDIAYFFFSIANKKALNKLDIYLKEYYEELSQQIIHLGSNPDRVYPYSVFDKEWKLYCKSGFAMAFVFIKFMLLREDEINEGDVANMIGTNDLNAMNKYNNEKEYIDRVRMLGEFMVKNNYL